ncbi:hypothetical protein [Thiohalocapsa sp.]|uniref:hypothetical protein n=1 Tax=Thiohalocapsa sp. TaxID=2497641 RepID=UPI0025EC45B3|nr:hypothetical protein [Thiohalocapsa sp.]
MHVYVSAGIIAAASLINTDVAWAQASPEFTKCAWPVELSPEGSGNFLAPDDRARYWLMPFDTAYQTMEIAGAYPNARYFSFVAYDGDATARPSDTAAVHLYDTIIAPDEPSSDTPPADASGNDSFTVYITREGTTAANTINVSSNYAWVALRMYVPSPDPALGGQALTGGVPLPTVTLYGADGGQPEVLEPCPLPAPPEGDWYPVRSVNKLTDVNSFLQVLFPPGFELNQPRDYDEPAGDRLWFAPPDKPPIVLMPNPDNKYIIMIPGPYQPGRLIVIHAKAATFSSAYAGPPYPAPGSEDADMRYWSVCNNDFALPISTVRCLTDQSVVTTDGYYTIVMSDDLVRPDWLPADVNWLPWGDEQYPKLIFYRHMIPVVDESEYADIPFAYAIQKVVVGCYEDACIHPEATIKFTLPDLPPRAEVTQAGPYVQEIMGDYYPVTAWCDKSTFESGGWEACLAE